MLITCTGCASKIRVPDSAAGKRVKCPKCATLIRIPEAESPHERAKPEATGVSPTPLPPTLPAESDPELKETPPDSTDPDAFSTRPSSSGSKPPPIKKKRACSLDDADDDDEPQPPIMQRRKYDEDDEDDEDDDDLDVRKRRGRSQPVNGLAMTSMIMGIISVVSGLPGWTGCCCGTFTAIAGITGIVAVILGYMGKSPGSEAYAITGIISGFVGIGLALIGVLWIILSITLHVGMIGMGKFN
jgi:predicted Zn finger-like uncharacterized protein